MFGCVHGERVKVWVSGCFFMMESSLKMGLSFKPMAFFASVEFPFFYFLLIALTVVEFDVVFGVKC